MKRTLSIVCAIGSVFLIFPSSALAHPMKGVGDFYAGMLHPMISVECVLPIIALSLLAGQQNRRTAIGVLLSFPSASVLGALLALVFPVSPFVAVINTAAMAVLGVLVALNRSLPLEISVILSATLALTVGWSNGGELTSNTSAYRFVPGLAVVSLLLISYGIGLVRSLNMPWAKTAVRVTGSWIAAIGILVLSLNK
ncbi:MAG TPA: HupE/UreJ family protein [Terriglobales bacterium]|nr:HupE/UreJ family protein [Terriglobales bacterium]